MRPAGGGASSALLPLPDADRWWRWLPSGRPGWHLAHLAAAPRPGLERAATDGERLMSVALMRGRGGLPLCQPRFAGLAPSGFTPLNTRARSGCAASGPFKGWRHLPQGTAASGQRGGGSHSEGGRRLDGRRRKGTNSACAVAGLKGSPMAAARRAPMASEARRTGSASRCA